MEEILKFLPFIILGFVLIFIIVFMFRFKSGAGMGSLLKNSKNMLASNQDALEELAEISLKTKKNILEKNADDMAYIAEKEAEIKSRGIKIAAKAVKDGFTDNGDSKFCKHCGVGIDADSKFCNKCGKEQ